MLTYLLLSVRRCIKFVVDDKSFVVDDVEDTTNDECIKGR